jgi:hypothetical protein
MTVLVILLVVFVVAVVALLFAGEDAAILAIVPAIGVLIVGLMLIIIPVSRHYGRVACHTFSEQTGRPTKFVIYTSFDTGDCLTPTANGKWIPTKNLREFGEKP